MSYAVRSNSSKCFDLLALTAKQNELFVYENGIGAINLPYDGTQIGTLSTRAVNPISLLRMSEFISTLTGSEFRVHNPFLFSTKAEMCGHSAIRQLAEYIRLTFSCDGFPIRKKEQSQCGLCTSCLLRRQSLESAGLSVFDSDLEYLRSWRSSFIDRVKLRPLMAMEWQAQKLAACLANKSPWQKLVSTFPFLLEVASEYCLATGDDPERVRNAFLKLYAHYVAEWNDFSARSFTPLQAVAV